MLGIDYSSGSVELSQGVAKARGWEAIKFEVVNFMSGEPSQLGGMKDGEGWDLLWVHANINESNSALIVPIDWIKGPLMRLPLQNRRKTGFICPTCTLHASIGW